MASFSGSASIRHTSPWSGTQALHTLAGPATAPAAALRHVGTFLTRRCGSLENAFSDLDPMRTGCLSLESFTRGMEKLGCESALAETTRVFQAMDPASSGSVGLQTFLAMFKEVREQLDESRISITSYDEPRHARTTLAEEVAALAAMPPLPRADSLMSNASNAMTTGPDSADGGSANLADSSKASDMASRVSNLEVRLETDISRLREFCERASVRHAELLEARCLDIERESSRRIELLESRYMDSERASTRHAELLEAKSTDSERALARQAELLEATCLEASAVTQTSEDLKAKVEALRQHVEQRLQDTDMAAEQQHLDFRSAVAKIDTMEFGIKDQTLQDGVRQQEHDLGGQFLAVKRELLDSMDLQRSTVEGTLGAFRAEMKSALEEERTASTDRTRALGRALSEEFERSILVQASACARSEASSISGGVVAKELETFHKESGNALSKLVGNVHLELAQFAERLTIVEDRSKNLRATETALLSDLASSSDGQNLRPSRAAIPEGQVHAAVSDLIDAEARIAERNNEARIRALIAEEERKHGRSPVSTTPVTSVSMESERTQDVLNKLLREMKDSQTPGKSPRTTIRSAQVAQARMEPARLESTLQAIISKLDSQCIDALAPDLKELHSLLSDQVPRGDDQALQSTTSSAVADFRDASASASIVRQRTPLGSRDDGTDSSDKASSTQGGDIMKLREDILGCLRSDFSSMVSTTLQDIKKTEARVSSPSRPIQGGIGASVDTFSSRPAVGCSVELPPNQGYSHSVPHPHQGLQAMGRTPAKAGAVRQASQDQYTREGSIGAPQASADRLGGSVRVKGAGKGGGAQAGRGAARLGMSPSPAGGVAGAALRTGENGQRGDSAMSPPVQHRGTAVQQNLSQSAPNHIRAAAPGSTVPPSLRAAVQLQAGNVPRGAAGSFSVPPGQVQQGSISAPAGNRSSSANTRDMNGARLLPGQRSAGVVYR